MIDFGNVWGIARAEMRLTRRVARFWIFTTIAALFALLVYIQFWAIHSFFSGTSASAASAYPRFFMGAFGSNFVFMVLIGLVFLGFDLRARDTRERMVEVLDTLPYTNIELVFGKFLGILVPSWIAVLVISAVLALLSATIGTLIEPWSFLAFIVFMSIPAYTFFLGLVFLMASLFRQRLVVALASVALIVLLWVAGQWWVPLHAYPWIDVTGGFSLPFPSDIVPRVIDGAGLVQRLGFLAAGFGLLGLAAATHPRKDDGSRGLAAAVSAALVVGGLGLCVAQALGNKADIDRRAHWAEVHERRSGAPVPDLLATTGTLRIQPGRSLDMELSLRFTAREGDSLDEALFTLNPGLEIRSVADEAGSALDFTHEDGLLAVRLPRALPAGTEATIRMEVGGLPDAEFAYLDAAVEPFTRMGREAALLILGYESFMSDRRFVALPPGVRWLPSSGPQAGRGDRRPRARDFQEVDLTVEVPAGWLVAGPGRRREVPGAPAGRARFRFAPGAPLPELALVAGRYESRSAEVHGAVLEILVSPAHAAVFDLFEDASGEITTWLEEKFSEAAAVGMVYPYDALTLAEVPNGLRGYTGGWRMDSAMIQPALILMKESGFPTAWFKRAWSDEEQYRDREGGLARRKREVLEAFFENDMNGGNPFIASARSFFGFQTAGTGPEGLPLDFVFEDLTARLVTEHRGYFSYRIFDEKFGQEFQFAGQQMQNADRVGEKYSDVLIHRLTSRPEVWEAVLESSLVQLDPWLDPGKTIDVLALKGGAMAQSMLDDLGHERTGRFLGELRAANTGQTFGRAEVLTSGARVEADLASWMSTWLDETDLPGFTLGEVRVERIRDAEDSTPRYQSIVTVRNEERVAGLVKVEYRKGSGTARADRGATEPVRVEARSAVEIGLITSEAPTALRVAPYLALNRDPFGVPLPAIDSEKIVEAEPFTGSRPVAWEPAQEGIVVDDLDPGFSIEESGERQMLRVAGRGAEEALDQGLPITERRRGSRWSRMAVSSAHGKYRHTLAVIGKGSGDKRAVFAAELPASGRWELEYFFAPPTRSAGLEPGTWKLTLVDGSRSQELTFDAGGGEAGWNSLGTFEIAGGAVRLLVSNETQGAYVAADAIRWKPARGSDQVASR